MSKNNGGKIINISSDLVIISPDQRIYSKNFKKPISYSVVKHGIIGLTKYTATYWAKNNITCNAIAPGGIYNNQPESFVKKVKKLIPIGRMAKKDEYNFLLLFLSSKHSSIELEQFLLQMVEEQFGNKEHVNNWTWVYWTKASKKYSGPKLIFFL